MKFHCPNCNLEWEGDEEAFVCSRCATDLTEETPSEIKEIIRKYLEEKYERDQEAKIDRLMREQEEKYETRS